MGTSLFLGLAWVGPSSLNQICDFGVQKTDNVGVCFESPHPKMALLNPGFGLGWLQCRMPKVACSTPQ